MTKIRPQLIPAAAGLRAVYAVEKDASMERVELPIVGFAHSGEEDDPHLTPYVLHPTEGPIEAEEARSWALDESVEPLTLLIGYVEAPEASAPAWPAAVEYIRKLRTIERQHADDNDEGKALIDELVAEGLIEREQLQLLWNPVLR